ncbi:hypothetical protein KSP39_PZI017951 [Platanthera zijinensis]|uniref:Uncharacterized protein n=1 Tax=Platanthera zijinensis TaxID=2320716 RepID=A0AAP0B5P8_9ASPA
MFRLKQICLRQGFTNSPQQSALPHDVESCRHSLSFSHVVFKWLEAIHLGFKEINLAIMHAAFIALYQGSYMCIHSASQVR